MSQKVDISVVLLLEDESPDFAEYTKILHDFFQRRETAFEIIIIANGVEGFLKSQVDLFTNGFNNIKAFSFPNRVSQAVCVRAALKESQADIIVMCGSYQQITIESFDECMNAFEENIDLICPWRQERVDPAFNQIQSRFFNYMLTSIAGSKLHDMSCTIRIFRRHVLEDVRIYGNMYRFLPILAQQKGYRVSEVPCTHFQERGKTGLYRFSEYVSRLVDIGTLYFNTRFSRKPLRFFSSIGTGLILTGLFFLVWVLFQKIFGNISVGNSPQLMTAIILMVAGIQTAGIGLLGEIISFTHGRGNKEYTIEKII